MLSCGHSSLTLYLELFLAGYGLDRLVPSLTPAGVLVGAAVGFGGAIYVMVTGLRAYVNSESSSDPSGKEDAPK